MKHYFSDSSERRFGRKDLYLVLLAFAIGVSVDCWFNNHQSTHMSSSNGASVSSSTPIKSKSTAQKTIINLLL